MSSEVSRVSLVIKSKQVMKKSQIKTLIKLIEKQLIETDTMFKDGSQPHPYIVGYLQGTLKTIQEELQSHSGKK